MSRELAGSTRTRWWVRHRRLAIPFGLILLVLIAAVAWIALRAWQIDRSVVRSEGDIARIRAALTSSDWSSLKPEAGRLAHDARRAASATHDPLWVAASHIPIIGGNLTAPSIVARTLDNLSGEAVAPLINSRALGLVEGHNSDLRSVVDALHTDAPAIQTAANALKRASRVVAAVRVKSLLPGVRNRVLAAQAKLDRASRDVVNLAYLAQVTPRLLGQGQPRTVLLVFQTPAEQRGTGGLVGAWGEIRADDGALSLVRFGSVEDLPRLSTLPSGVNPDTEKIFGSDLLKPQNFNLSASFPDAARLLASSWSAGPGDGRRVDAIVSIDPVALADVLSVVGPVTTKDGFTISSANAADELLRKQYYKFAGTDQAPRVAFLGEVTQAVFSRLTKGAQSPVKLGRQLARSAAQGRLLVWAADPGDQAAWRSLGMAGELGEPTTTTAVLAFNSLDGSKLGAYLHTSVMFSGCPASGGPVVEFTLRSEVPADLPWYPGTHIPGLAPTTMRLGYSFYVAPQWGVASISVNGKRVGFSAQTERKWSIIRGAVDVPSGGTSVVSVHLVGAPGVPNLSRVRVEPQAYPVAVVASPAVGRCQHHL